MVRSKSAPRAAASSSGGNTARHLFGDERAVVGVDDLVLLSAVSETSILENLKVRHAADVIYSYIGHVLVVVNPYKWLDIYDEASMRAYTHKARIDVPPHVFATAEEAYRSMLSDEENQCVIISGESGAGKTEASKQIQNYIASVSGSGAGVDKVKRTFLESNPLLEAFGNAKTLRNNNSSRFGKYFELLFDSAGRPQGGKVTNYLLEKSRVVKPGKGERNFHIFYQVLAGLPAAARSKFELPAATGATAATQFAFLRASGCYDVDDVDDAAEFDDTMAAMTHVGIKRKQIELVLQTIAAILHVGNITFESIAVDDAEGSCVSNRQALTTACRLLGVDAAALEHALCYKLLQTMAPGGAIESFEVPQNATQAAGQRDALAKSVYDRLFSFLVERVNHALDIDKQAAKMTELTSIDASMLQTIGILDIYGFEVFDSNGFEQFCINYVNEKLQQLFIELTLKSEQDEYAREGIAWTPIPFFNNHIVCDLIDAKRPTPGIFLILDDTVKTMHSRDGTAIDATFLDKVASLHSRHAHFSKRGKTFEIQHYAGGVQYSVDGFGDATKDFLSKDIAVIVSASTNKLVRYIFPEAIDLLDKRMPHTAGYRIRTQCDALVTTLMDCAPHYVRCIKSNDHKQPQRLDDRRVLHQIKYLGLLENVKVRRAGYAYRGDYGRFVDRFKLLSSETYPVLRTTDKKGTQAILRSAARSALPQLEREAQLGKTMVFIQTPETFFALEQLREQRISGHARVIQRAWTRYAGRRHLLQLSHDITKLYTAQRKQRQRVSIYRPFDALYVRDAAVHAAIVAIIQYYNDSEKLLFVDTIQKAEPVHEAQAPGGSSGSASSSNAPIVLVERLLVVTDAFVYLMEQRTWQPPPAASVGIKSQWEPPLVFLRRRLPLHVIDEIVMSTLADPFFVLRVRQDAVLREPDKRNWLENRQTMVCMATGKKFGLFNRRHHCRVTGKIYCSDVCKQLEVVPDRGFYVPVRVFDRMIGLFSTEVAEDQLLTSEKKTEIAVTLVDAIRRLTQQMIPITFSDSVTLRTAASASGATSAFASLSRSPPQPIAFVVATSTSSSVVTQPHITGTTSSITIHVAPGVPDEYIRKRRRREKARRKRMEQQRDEELAVRAQRQAEREHARETERLRRVAEKKAKKAAEKETRRTAMTTTHTRRGSKNNMDHVRKFGESVQISNGSGSSASASHGNGASSFGGANSELAAVLARRRSDK